MYKAEIVKSSWDMSKIERVKYKDTSRAQKIDMLIEESGIIINVFKYVILHIQCDKAEKGEYDVIILIDEGGNMFQTGSSTFISNFEEIWDEIVETESDIPLKIEIFRKESNNYKGKYFITCGIVC